MILILSTPKVLATGAAGAKSNSISGAGLDRLLRGRLPDPGGDLDLESRQRAFYWVSITWVVVTTWMQHPTWKALGLGLTGLVRFLWVWVPP